MKDVALFFLILIAFPLGAMALTLTLALTPYASVEQSFSPWVDSNGNISLPTDFRSNWAHLGSWFVGGDNGLSEFHEVYIEPESAQHFRETQEFPDGATLVKEVRGAKAATMTTGHANWADDEKIWFVMIKDTESRFEGNPLWGDGWGWALFEAKDTSTNVTKDYYQECISCHLPAKQTDWVYVQGYPTLEWPSPSETKPATEVVSASEVPSPSDMTGMPGVVDRPDGPVVYIENLVFTPSAIQIKPGETITWINRDYVPHTATADDGRFDSGTINPGERGQITFEETGTFPYHCTPHPFMKASVIVDE